MVPMDRGDRNRQGLQKLFLPHVPDSAAEIDPHIPKDYHHIVFADPEPFTEKLYCSKLPMSISCYVNHAIILSECPPSGRYPDYTISLPRFT